MEYYSTIKGNEILIHTAKYMNLKTIMQSESHQKRIHTVYLYKILQKYKLTYSDRKRISCLEAKRKKERGVKRHEDTCRGDG